MKFVLLFLFIILSSQISFAGGASLVGNGGFSVDCQGTIEILDVFEANLKPRKLVYTLGDSSASLNDKISIGLERMKIRYHLNANEFLHVKKAARFTKASKFDPLRHGHYFLWGALLNSIEIKSSQDVDLEITRRGCFVDIVYFRPVDTPQNRIVFDDLCGKSASADFEYCFFVNSDVYWKLNKDQKACLAIHEAFRFLPKEKLIHDEIQMRQHVAEICTQ
jgi:hypothetical protein